jgi:hypothetical protein
MHSGPTPRLPGHRLVLTRDPDEACAWLDARGISLDVAARDARQFSMCLNGVSLPNRAISFSYVYYDARVSVTTTEANRDYWVLPPICGALEGATGKMRPPLVPTAPSSCHCCGAVASGHKNGARGCLYA